MFCPNCGTQIPNGSSFCPSCGTRIGGSSASQPESNSQYGQPAQGSYVQPDPQTGPQSANQVVIVNQAQTLPSNVKTCDKNVFTWVFCFLIGGFGVDRFVRGQVGIGICKLLFNWCTLGIWALVDWIIAMVKAYGQAYGNERDFTFVNGKYSR